MSIVRRQPLLCLLRLEDAGRWPGAGKGSGFKAGPVAIVSSFHGLGEVRPAAVVQLNRGPGEVGEAEEAGIYIAVL